MDIKIVTFKNLTSVMCEIVEISSEGVMIKNPAKIVSIPDEEDPLRISFSPFLHFTKESLSGLWFEDQDILCLTTPVDDLSEHYKKIFDVNKTWNE